jgi:arylformamidase
VAVLQYRAEVDAAVTFTGGGGLQAQSFRLDLPHQDVTHPEIADLLVAAIGGPAVDRVHLGAVRIFAEPRPEGGAPTAARTRFVELSEVTDGGPGGTRLTGPGLAELPLERLAGLPAAVVRVAVAVTDLEPLAVAGHAVLLHTGGRPPYVTGAAATWLVGHGAALVGLDGACPGYVSDTLLAAGVPIVEHLIGLADLPPTGARFSAAPLRIAGATTSPVRAYAEMPWFAPHDHRRSAGWLPAADPR